MLKYWKFILLLAVVLYLGYYWGKNSIETAE